MITSITFTYTFLFCIYRSESPSQVFFILLTWLFSLIEHCNVKPEDMYLAYDNMCNLCNLKVSQHMLPLRPPFQDAWLQLRKVIDTFHLVNHVNPECHTKFSPKALKEKHPHANTQAGEQTFVWMGRFKHIVCAMNKTHHMFYLHRMIRRRNIYTEKCYKNGRKPILPKGNTHITPQTAHTVPN